MEATEAETREASARGAGSNCGMHAYYLELVHSITGPGQRTKRDSFDTRKVALSKVVEAIRMVLDVNVRSIVTSSR